jgi:hypothetical protein
MRHPTHAPGMATITFNPLATVAADAPAHTAIQVPASNRVRLDVCFSGLDFGSRLMPSRHLSEWHGSSGARAASCVALQQSDHEEDESGCREAHS